MDRKAKNLFEIVAQGDEIALQRLLLEGKEERNVATLAVKFSDFLHLLNRLTKFCSFSMATQCFTKQLGMDSVDV
jgi:hypothetical protein